MAKHHTYTFSVDDLFNGNNNSDNHTSVDVRTTDYADGYKRITALAEKVFPAGTKIRYNVIEGVIDESISVGCDGRYTILVSKNFENRPLPATLDEYHAALKEE